MFSFVSAMLQKFAGIDQPPVPTPKSMNQIPLPPQPIDQCPPPTEPEPHPNAVYTFKKPREQKFSIPNSIIKYMLENPTGKAWKKLIQTCKYFFSQYPVFPIQSLSFEYGSRWDADREIFDSNKFFPKLWLYGSLQCVDPRHPNTLQKFILQVFKCNLNNLTVFCQTLSWDTYQILISSGSFESMEFYKCSFTYSDGTDVTLDKLLENIEHLEKFKM